MLNIKKLIPLLVVIVLLLTSCTKEVYVTTPLPTLSYFKVPKETFNKLEVDYVIKNSRD